MHTERQTGRKEQLAQEKRRKKRVQRTCQICLAIGMIGLAITAVSWFIGGRNPVSAGGMQEQTDCYPDSLLKLMEHNPETEAFVKGYFENRD